ncbi:MAG TPA: MEDS domain-containing protein, partial [Kofleriaceae bacterium]|nr:MEDS domain-containing protein [Kofleriaceae bacterium]
MVTQPHHLHVVQIYEHDDHVAVRAVEFFRTGLAAGERCVAIAIPEHRDAILAGLRHAGAETSQLVILDARATLDELLVGGMPDAALLERKVGELVRGPTRVFGELVELLWRDNRADAALRLEQQWNALATRYGFHLLCAYSLTSAASGRLRDICNEHAAVHAPELGDPAHVTTRALVAEVARHAEVERALRETIRKLQQAEETERARATRNLQLQQATSALAIPLSLGELSDTILSTSAHLVGAVAAVVYLANADGAFELVGSRNTPGAAKWRKLPLDAPLPLSQALRARQPLWLERRDHVLAMFPNLTEEVLAASRTCAVAALPLIRGESLVGGLALSFETQRTFGEEERAWLESYATQCALAIDRVRQYVTEHKARSEAENLLRIAESLNNMHLDLEAILQRVTDEATALVGAQFGAFFYNVTNERG